MARTIAIALYFCCLVAVELSAAEIWQTALSRMPLSSSAPLNRDNSLALLLNSFQSNELVKALVILPAVSDDFYLINRNQPKLNLKATNLLEAITGLTNATALRATFSSGLLLLHLERDRLQPVLVSRHQPTAERLKNHVHFPHAIWIDGHWERLQPQLRNGLKMEIVPSASSIDAWHFARHNVAAWNLSDWELLAALSLTGKTVITVEKNRLLFGLQ